jgi:hypothetical protein
MNIALINAFIALAVAVAKLIAFVQGNATLKPYLDDVQNSLESLFSAHKSTPPQPPAAA